MGQFMLSRVLSMSCFMLDCSQTIERKTKPQASSVRKGESPWQRHGRVNGKRCATARRATAPIRPVPCRVFTPCRHPVLPCGTDTVPSPSHVSRRCTPF
jgi:hypothetical protein